MGLQLQLHLKIFRVQLLNRMLEFTPLHKNQRVRYEVFGFGIIKKP